MKISSITFLLSSLGVIAAENMMECVTNFEEGVDYFPDKVEVKNSEHWSITYENSYKIVRNTDANLSYLLYQCGTEVPQDEANKHDVVIPVPLADVGLHYTTFIPYMELLGKRSSISYMAGQASWVYSPCLNEMIDDNLVTMISDINNNTILGQLEVDQDLPYFIGVGAGSNFTQNFEISEWKETSMLAIFEWIKFFSVFFNKEHEANEIFDDTKDRVECAAENAAFLSSDGAKPVVLWGAYSDYCGGWDVARSCPNYYCELAEKCDATLLTSMEGSVDAMSTCYRNYMTTEEFVEYGKDADYWIYAGHSDGVDSILTKFGDELKDFKSIKNDQVYDVAGQTMDAWFGVRKVEPDTLIQDFCKIVGKENPAAPVPHQLTFLRHIDDPIDSPAVCTDTDAPMVKLGSSCLRIVAEEEEDPNAAPSAKLLAALILTFVSVAMV